MPRSKSKSIRNVLPSTPAFTSVENHFTAFLMMAKAQEESATFELYQSVIVQLHHFLNTNFGDNYCKNAPFKNVVPALEYFCRYHILRELSLKPNERAMFTQGCLDFMTWMYQSRSLAEQDNAKLDRLIDHIIEMERRSMTAAQLLMQHCGKLKSSAQEGERIEFGRHDVSKKEGSSVWFEVWSLPVLPAEKIIGPVLLPQEVASLIEVGWIIACEIQRNESGWELVDSTNIYPALPYRTKLPDIAVKQLRK